jgi:DNA-binding LacI/PurR family transcriptional regulator
MPRPNRLLPRFLGQFRQQIRSGFAPGERLPSTREWARMHGISQSTVRRILNQLAKEGLLRFRARFHSVRSNSGSVPGKPARKRRTLRLGLISRFTEERWTDEDEYPLIARLLSIASKRGMTVVPVPHHMIIRAMLRQHEIDLARIPWNDFDVGLFTDAIPQTLSNPALKKHPVLSVDGDATDYGIDSVCYDNFNTGRQLAEFLFELGHRRFAVTDEVNAPGWPNSIAWTTRRFGFEGALGQLGGCVRPSWRMETHLYHHGLAVPLRRPKMIQAAAKSWSAMPQESRPTALYTPEASLLDGIENFGSHGLSIPDQLSLVTCAWRKQDTVKLGLRITHAWFDIAALAKRALDAAEELFYGKRMAPHRAMTSRDGDDVRLFEVPTLLTPGDSTTPPPS